MQVSILGAGGVAYSYAAFLASRGHEPTVWSPSGKRACELRSGMKLTASNALDGSFAVGVATSEAQATEADVLILAVPAYGYRAVLDRILPILRDGQTLIISAHLSFAALYLSRRLSERGIDCPIVVWNTTASTGRQTGPANVSVSLLRAKVEMAVIPDTAGAKALALCQELFGDRFALVSDMIGVDLGNLNPAVHYGIAMFNLTRMELAEDWPQQAHITPAVARFLEDLDRERLALANAFGVQARSIHQAYAVPGKIEIAPLAEMMRNIVATRKGVNGPKSLDTRYVTEDVPYGLLTTIRLAEMTGVEVPLHRAGVTVFSSLYGRDFTAENTILPEIAPAFASVDKLRAALRNGWSAV
ncbi:NAD/NADP octopine/nopaline dehydrogenase family protein [Paracoccus sp. Z330]|uniref:2-dehydropantoate 2-reductase n=1 Tax=Paracoccus onchidii TaxID=3017813 RepID=A0ABT4ZEC1_9RHOB|nr:NAD/NADP octopine/nopaline dehydrogenase family protein [Paracoccus onchidii]MDB6177699.1 NAD/NADP octopine/nopaline dehydrogenase family protein [Paracoccus onchidii]